MNMKVKGLVFGLTLLFAIVLIQSGCVTQSKCERKFPTKDSVSIEFKDRIVAIHDTAWLPSIELSFDTSSIGLPKDLEFHHKEKKGKLTGTVDISKGKLSFDCKADSFQHVIDSLVILTDKSEFKQIKSKPEVVEVYPWWAKPCLYWFIGSLILLILWLAYKYLSGYVRGFFK